MSKNKESTPDTQWGKLLRDFINGKVKPPQRKDLPLVESLAQEVQQKLAKYYNECLWEISAKYGQGVYWAVVGLLVKLQSAQFKQQYRLDDSPYAVLGLTADAPDDVVRFAYLYWARQLHPDRGGDSQKMARVNDAMQRIAIERGWKTPALPEGGT